MKEPTYTDWIELTEGILLSLCGLALFFVPSEVSRRMILLYGIAAALIGCANILIYSKIGHEMGVSHGIALASGCLSILLGLYLASRTSISFIRFLVLLGLWTTTSSITKLELLKQDSEVLRDAFRTGYAIYVCCMFLACIAVFGSLASVTLTRNLLANTLTILGIYSCICFVMKNFKH